MLPINSKHDGVDRSPINTVLPSKMSLGTAIGMTPPNVYNLIARKNSHGVCLSPYWITTISFLAVHVLHVFRSRSKKKVIGVAAGRVIAFVTTIKGRVIL